MSKKETKENEVIFKEEVEILETKKSYPSVVIVTLLLIAVLVGSIFYNINLDEKQISDVQVVYAAKVFEMMNNEKACKVETAHGNKGIFVKLKDMESPSAVVEVEATIYNAKDYNAVVDNIRIEKQRGDAEIYIRNMEELNKEPYYLRGKAKKVLHFSIALNTQDRPEMGKKYNGSFYIEFDSKYYDGYIPEETNTTTQNYDQNLVGKVGN